MTYSEWDMDLDNVSVPRPSGGGSSSNLATKGRCVKCWGALTASGDSKRGCTAIRCRVCGAELLGRDADEEMKRMKEEQLTNLFKMDLGADPSDRSGQFTFKIFPDVGRLTKAEVEHRAATQEPRDTSKPKPLTRTEVPVGAAGWFIFQGTDTPGRDRAPYRLGRAILRGVH